VKYCVVFLTFPDDRDFDDSARTRRPSILDTPATPLCLNGSLRVIANNLSRKPLRVVPEMTAALRRIFPPVTEDMES